MPGQRRDVLEWPYLEGLRMDEAMHPLTLLSLGMYGEVLLIYAGVLVVLLGYRMVLRAHKKITTNR